MVSSFVFDDVGVLVEDGGFSEGGDFSELFGGGEEGEEGEGAESKIAT